MRTRYGVSFVSSESGGHFKNTYELLNLRALKFSPVNKTCIFHCMGKIICVEFQREPLKFHTKYLTHALKIWFLYNIDISRAFRFKCSYAFLKRPLDHILQSPQYCIQLCSIGLQFNSSQCYCYYDYIMMKTHEKTFHSIAPFFNTLWPRLNGCHFSDDSFKWNFCEQEMFKLRLRFHWSLFIWFELTIFQDLVQIMAWCLFSAKPLSEPMMVSLLSLICITQPQWVKINTVFPGLKFRL